MSIVKIVELELKIEVRLLISAAIITANIIPERPVDFEICYFLYTQLCKPY